MAFRCILLLTILTALSATYATAENIRIYLQIQYSIPGKPDVEEISIDVPKGIIVVEAMKIGADRHDRYRFGGTYYGSFLGWFPEKYDNIVNDYTTPLCWYVYLQTPGNELKRLENKAISDDVITEDYSRLILRYQYDPDCHDPGLESKTDTKLKSEL